MRLTRLRFPGRLLLLCWVLFALSARVASSPADDGPASRQCILGIFPFLSAQRLESIFAPIGAVLDKVLDCDLRYQSASDYRTFMKRLGERRYIIAYVQPFDYVRLARPSGYLPLAARNARLRATIVVREDSRIKSLPDLRGKTVALPPAVAAISYLTKVALKNDGIEPGKDVTLVHTKNHASCIQQVLIGKAEACGTVDTVVSMFEKKHDIELKWLAQTPGIPQALFVVRDDVDATSLARLQQALFNIRLDPAGLALFNNHAGDRIFRRIEDSEYDLVRQYWREFGENKTK